MSCPNTIVSVEDQTNFFFTWYVKTFKYADLYNTYGIDEYIVAIY